MQRAMAMMSPGEKDQTRKASIDLIREMADDPSGSPRFIQNCREFLEKYQEGDVVLEFCSSKQSWREGMGRGGYLLLRDGKDIASLTTKMN